MIVVDSNVIIYLHLSSGRTRQAVLALRRDPHWLAPPLWQTEFRNVLAGYLRRKLLVIEETKSIMRAAMKTLDGREVLPPSDLVLDLVAVSDCSAYDCEFVALAAFLDIRLVTVDKGILRDFPHIAVDLGTFVSGG